jgi:hypothetical protein
MLLWGSENDRLSDMQVKFHQKIEILPADVNVPIGDTKELSQKLTVLIEWMDRMKQKLTNTLTNREGI